jgi:hypothetical protein
MQISCFPALLVLWISVASAFAADVRDLGARGDGKADDTSVIQRAVDSGGAVRFPAGAYRLTRTVTIDLEQSGFVALSAEGPARVIMAGPGPAFQFIGTHAGSAAPESFKSNVWERQSTPRVDGLEIVGGHPDADGIAAKGTMQLTITRVVVREARHGIRLHDRNRNVLISDCHLYHNRGIGVFLDAVNLHQINITGSHISYNAGGGVVVRGGGNVRNLQIGNCDIESNMAPNAPATANVLIDSTGGAVGEIAITGCTIQHASNAPGSANIRVLGGGQAPATARTPATPTNEGNITISGNVLSDVRVNVHLQNARGVTLTGNTFWVGFDHDLLVEDSSHVIVGPNNFDRNPLYLSEGRDVVRGGVAFRRSRDCTITGLQINGVRHHPAAVLLEGCSRFNVSGSTILDSDGIGLRLQDTALSRVSGCLIRDDRPGVNAASALVVTGGRGNSIIDNVLDRPAEIAPGVGTSRDNEVVPRSTSPGRNSVRPE